MAQKKYPDGTHRMWVRVTDEVETDLRYHALDTKSSSVEVLGGALIADALRAARKAAPPLRKRKITKR